LRVGLPRERQGIVDRLPDLNDEWSATRRTLEVRVMPDATDGVLRMAIALGALDCDPVQVFQQIADR